MLDFDLIVLDVMMPGQTGLDFASEIRRSDDVPILMLTAMGDTKDRIAGLETGVDDYLGKPFEPRELLLRVQNVLKRNRAAAAPAGEPQRHVSFGPFQFDQELGELTNKGKRAPLTDAETALLRVFTTRLGEVLSRETLCKRSVRPSTSAPSTCRSRACAARSSPTRPSRAICAPSAAKVTGWSTHERVGRQMIVSAARDLFERIARFADRIRPRRCSPGR